MLVYSVPAAYARRALRPPDEQLVELEGAMHLRNELADGGGGGGVGKV